MNTTTVKFQTLGYARSKTWLAASLFIAGNVAFPQLCHLIPNGGIMLLPIYFFTLIGACKYGWKVGLLTAIASPLLNSLLFGMPAAASLPAILFKSTVLAIVAGYAASHFKKISLPVILGVILTYQIVGTAFEWALTGSLFDAAQDFRMGLPGMAIQAAGCWAFARYMLNR